MIGQERCHDVRDKCATRNPLKGQFPGAGSETGEASGRGNLRQFALSERSGVATGAKGYRVELL